MAILQHGESQRSKDIEIEDLLELLPDIRRNDGQVVFELVAP